ncbi:hypothetical protein LCGC14_0563090 [marine sediment metagenome]|uniref:Carbonate dehydratase n=1 Tax=marine sediment metagenome TaxID=412755 RepID=A0A0F9U7Y7_9ZZZZ|nr:carbonate dehydratase [Phycisphaerae bacterium]HDZ44635.1 carbonate dehydratase [Phycisphaerae bacterium]
MERNLQTRIRPNPSGDWPEIDPTAYIDPTAQVIGRVRIGPRVFVGPNAVIRADEVPAGGDVKPIVVEAECNVQDGVIVHALAGSGVTIGQRTSLAHGAIVHGPCSLGERCFVGFGAVVFRANVSAGAFIAARAVVEDVDIPPETFVPPLTLISQDQLGQLRKTNPRQRDFMQGVIQTNLQLAEGYLASAQP